MIAAALILVLLLLFIYGILIEKPISNPPEVTGGVVAEVGGGGVLEFVFIILILFVLFLIYRALMKPAENYIVPAPKKLFVPEDAEQKIEPKIIPPKFYEPIYRKPVLPVKNVYFEKKVEERHNEKDEGVHQELTKIRDMLGGGEHEIAKKRFVRVSK